MSDTQDVPARLRLALPNVPRPPEIAALSAAIETACFQFGDVGVGRGVEAITAAEIIHKRGHSVRCAVWAVWELVAQGALQAHPRPTIDVVRESGESTFELIEDPRPRYMNGLLIPDGPYPVAEGDPIPWFAAILEPKHSALDQILADLKTLATEPVAAATIRKSTCEVIELECQTPALDAGSEDWLTPAEVKRLDNIEVDSLRVLRSGGQRNAEKLFGVDKSGRRWRKPTVSSSKVFYWKPSLLSQRRDK